MSEKASTIEEIYDHIGGLSWFQLIMILLVASGKTVMGWSMMVMSYAGYINDYHCITDTETDMYDDDDAGSNTTTLNVCTVNGTECKDYRFLGTKRTAVSEWNLVCDLRWMKATIISVQMAGVLTGATLGGLSGDYFGRKKTFYFSTLLHAVFNIIAGYSLNWQMFTAVRFIIGILIGGTLGMTIPYPTEFLPKRWRHLIPVIPSWQLGVMVFAGVAALLEDWSQLHVICGVISAVQFLGIFYIPESPRWLATQGMLDESYGVLQKIARVNGKSLPPEAMEVIKRIASDEKRECQRKKYTYRDLFKTRSLTKFTIVFGITLMILSIIFYGLNFAVSSFVGNLYMNIFLMNVLQVFSDFLAFVAIERSGRRLTSLVFMGITALVSFACVAVQASASERISDKVISYLCLLAQLLVNGCWEAVAVWITESYPTVMRSLGFAFSSMAARVGGIIAPFLINLDELPLFTFIFMAALSLVCVVGLYFLPEVSDQAMAETVHEVASHHKNPASLTVENTDVTMTLTPADNLLGKDCENSTEDMKTNGHAAQSLV